MEFRELITSKSRYAVLKLMALRLTPLHLRGIADATNLSPRGAALACEFLVKAKVLKTTPEGNKKLFALNPSASLSPIIKEHFTEERNRELATRANQCKDGAEVLDFINQVASMSWNIQ